jgi:monofunctional glycosyltransferase
MARKAAGKAGKGKEGGSRRARPSWRTLRRWAARGALGVAGFVAVMILLYAVVNPPTTPYMLAEARRHGGVEHVWVPMERIAPVMARSAVAAEDANFCLHWGFDMAAIREAIDRGAARGASTIPQQVVKNVYLWHGRSWPRKALEAGLTPRWSSSGRSGASSRSI